MQDSFAVIPDNGSRPAAVFANLEDAIDWAMQRFGGDRFKIRHFGYLDTTSPTDRQMQ